MADHRDEFGGMLPSSWPVGELFDWEIAPLTFRFSDPDGNRLYVSEES